MSRNKTQRTLKLESLSYIRVFMHSFIHAFNKYFSPPIKCQMLEMQEYMSTDDKKLRVCVLCPLRAWCGSTSICAHRGEAVLLQILSSCTRSSSKWHPSSQLQRRLSLRISVPSDAPCLGPATAVSLISCPQFLSAQTERSFSNTDLSPSLPHFKTSHWPLGLP